MGVGARRRWASLLLLQLPTNCCIAASEVIGHFRTNPGDALPIAHFVQDFADAQSGLRLLPDAATRAAMLATPLEASYGRFKALN
jgi:hypothetical protein